MLPEKVRATTRLPFRLREHRREIARFADAPWDDPDAMDARRLAGLQRTVARAARRSPFYGPLLRDAPPIRSLDDLATLPVTSKLDMRASGRERAAPGSRLSRRETFRTSGSSGQPYAFEVGGFYGDRHNAQRAWVYLEAGVPAGARLTEIHSFDRHFGPQRSFPTFARTMVGYRTDDWVDVAIASEPTLLYGNRSHLVEVADAVRDRDVELPVPWVCSSSETLLPSDERLFAEVFGARVFEVYGSAEISNAAYRLPDQETWPILEPRVIVEVLGDDRRPVAVGEVGELVVTTLTEPTSPMIRYATGDLARVASGSAEGRSGLRLAALEGRSADAVLSAAGDRVTFWEIAANRFWAWGEVADNIARYQVHQRADRSIRVAVELAPGGSVEAIRTVVVEHLRSRLGDLPVELVEVDRVHDPATGKFRAVTSDAV